MTKVLIFQDDSISQTRFALLYQGLCLSTRGQQVRDLKQLKKEGALLDKFELVSILSNPNAPSERWQFAARKLNRGCVVEVDQEDLDMIKDYCTAVAWAPRAARDVADAIEWAWGAPEKSVAPGKESA